MLHDSCVAQASGLFSGGAFSTINFFSVFFSQLAVLNGLSLFIRSLPLLISLFNWFSRNPVSQ
jgi:hypothetical protein